MELCKNYRQKIVCTQQSPTKTSIIKRNETKETQYNIFDLKVGGLDVSRAVFSLIQKGIGIGIAVVLEQNKSILPKKNSNRTFFLFFMYLFKVYVVHKLMSERNGEERRVSHLRALAPQNPHVPI